MTGEKYDSIMTMEFTGEFETSRPREELFAYCADPDIIADCAPGLEEMNQISPSEYEAVITVGVGSVKPTFDVEATVVEFEEPRHLSMKAEGSGGRKGAFDATATMTLHETDSGGTLLEWEASANVSGIIASLGQRALGSVTKRLVGEMFDNLEEKVESDVEPNPRMAAASE